MSERVHLFLELWSGRLIEQSHGHKLATVSIAKSLKLSHGPDVKWLCVYTDNDILYEYMDNWYEDFLHILYTRNFNKPVDAKYYKNLLSYLSDNNPVLFNKYLDWIFENSKIKQIKF